MHRIITALIVLLAANTFSAQPFFPFCIDWHDAKKRNFTEQAAMLKELGYDGVGHIWLDKVEERIKTLDEVGLKLYQITMVVNIATNAPSPSSAKCPTLPATPVRSCCSTRTRETGSNVLRTLCASPTK